MYFNAGYMYWDFAIYRQSFYLGIKQLKLISEFVNWKEMQQNIKIQPEIWESILSMVYCLLK